MRARLHPDFVERRKQITIGRLLALRPPEAVPKSLQSVIEFVREREAPTLAGERLGERARPMLDYLRMFEACFNTFPGFEVEIQGVYREVDPAGKVRLHTYVVAQ